MMDEERLDWLAEKGTVKERPFAPSRPGFFGRVVVGFRTLWSQVATKWYVRPIVQQQNELNRRLVERLQLQESRLRQLDQTQAELIRETAELTTQLIQLNHLLSDLESRLAEQDATSPKID